jgi:hypothetical protein
VIDDIEQWLRPKLAPLITPREAEPPASRTPPTEEVAAAE